VLGEFGLEDGRAGTSGEEFGIDGEVGGDGMCCEQAAVMAAAATAAAATAARLDLVRFMVEFLR
jgi:hypothetical protein